MRKKISMIGIALAVLSVPLWADFTDNGDGTVTDSKTNLVWQKCSMGQDAKSCGGQAAGGHWYGAEQYCANLKLAGRTWRLPSHNDLASIRTSGPKPKIDQKAFPGTPATWYWTSTTNSASEATSVSFKCTGFIKTARVRSRAIRCVSSSPSNPSEPIKPSEPSVTPKSFIDNGNGTLTDSKDNLVWQKCSKGQDAKTCGHNAELTNWDNADEYCGKLTLAGRKWRLPSKEEMVSILYKGGRTMIDQRAFPRTPAAWYWTSTTYPASSSDVFSISFNYGNLVSSRKTSLSYVRCVSSGH